MIVLGFDIGGTKSAVLLAKYKNKKVFFLDRLEIKTRGDWKSVLDRLIFEGERMLKEHAIGDKEFKIGISCGGPLDSERGIIMSPPNLEGWNNVPVVDYLYEAFNVRGGLQNDADACALAEWKFGAGRGYRNLIFLTFGTGLGAGLILNGQLYSGSNNMAGEVGHIRLEDEGPIGYGKKGSFEGFCSGGGIAQIARKKALNSSRNGGKASYLKKDIESITAKDVAISAKKGNKDALEVFEISGKYFGRGLAILIDILNPEVIIAGSIYARSGELLEEAMYKEIEKESLYRSRKNVKILPAELGDRIGDYGAVVAAIYSLD